MSVRGKIFGLVLAVLIGSSVALAVEVPKALRYEVDPSWPKLPLPNNWVIGEIGGLFVDAEGLIWIINRPRTLNMRELSAARTPPASRCCIAAPPVIAFDRAGNVVHAWVAQPMATIGRPWSTALPSIIGGTFGSVGARRESRLRGLSPTAWS